MHDPNLSDPYTNPRGHPIDSSEKPKNSPKLTLEELKERLRNVRKESLDATNRGDYLKVAKLTAEAARLNQEILKHPGTPWR